MIIWSFDHWIICSLGEMVCFWVPVQLRYAGSGRKKAWHFLRPQNHNQGRALLMWASNQERFKRWLKMKMIVARTRWSFAANPPCMEALFLPIGILPQIEIVTILKNSFFGGCLPLWINNYLPGLGRAWQFYRPNRRTVTRRDIWHKIIFSTCWLRRR